MLLVLVGGVIQANADDYLPGTWNNWERNDASKFIYVDGVGTLTLNLAASTYYNFGIDNNGTWLKNSGTMVFNNCSNWTFDSSSENNCTIRTTIAGEYIFTITWSSGTPSISVTYPGTYDDVVYFCNTVNWTQPNAYILHSSYWGDNGSGSNKQPNGITMTNVSGNVWKAEFPSGARSGYIAFTKDEQNGYGNFYATKAVYRDDFPNTGSYVYVPSTTSFVTKNEVDYYNDGEWHAYPTYTRGSLTSGKLGTICLPFNAIVTGATVYKIVGKTVDGSDNLTGIYAEPVTNLVAGHAYLFKATDTSLTATYSGSYSEASEADGMLGNLSSTPVSVPTGKDYYIIKDNLIRKVAAGTVTIGQYKAYITLKDIPTGAPTHSAPGLTLIDCDEEATGIEGLEIENNQDAVYNLQGQRVTNIEKGVYIINGKKVLVK